MKKDDLYLRNKVEEYEEYLARARADQRVDRLTTQQSISEEIAGIEKSRQEREQQAAAEAAAAKKEAEKEATAGNEANSEGA